MPLPSPSKISNASLISFTSYNGMVKVTKSYGLKPFFSGALGCCFEVIGVVLIGGGGPFLLI